MNSRSTIVEVFAQPASTAIATGREESIEWDLFPSRSPHPPIPEPNPPFIFPMQSSPILNVHTDSETLPGGEAAGSRRSVTRGRPHHISINALPAFDFHPSGSGSIATVSSSPPQSPTKNVAIPARAGGHRRGGSEFIGGDGKTGGPGLMSTSPTKGEGALPAPQVARIGPSKSNRGHAHRRSGAISSHDLSTILRPKDLGPPRSGSAPTTPSDPGINQQFLPSLDRSASQPLITTVEPISESQLHSCGESVSGNSRPRPRVGFSDTLEFIPRPLSTISSDTSSSLSTIRASHSVTDSITSIVSGGTSSPPSAKKSHSPAESPMSYEPAMSRPKTASAILGSSFSVSSLGPVVEDMKRPSSAAASPYGLINAECSTNHPESKHLFYNAGYMPSTSGSLASSALMETSTQTPSHTTVCSLNYPVTSRHRPLPEPKVGKRQRKVKSWAGSILSRRGRHRNLHERTVNRRSVNPYLRNPTPVEDFSLDNVNFDEDTSHTVYNSQDKPLQSTRIDFSTWKPRQSSPFLGSDGSSHVLDLDAALGPFNTPTKGSYDVDVTGGFSVAKRRMHSSGTTGGFAGPGMHYHRRAESAPEMAPINYQTFGLHRLGSSSTMADVFEEDEENEGISQSAEIGTEIPSKVALEDTLHGLGVQIIEVENRDGEPPHRQNRIITQGESGDKDSPGLDPEPLVEHSGSVLVPGSPHEEMFPVEIVDAAEAPRFSVVTKSSDDSTITPRLSLDALSHRTASAPLDFVRPTTGQHFGTPDLTSSAVSSPSFANNSFDFPRINTAQSSITDRTAWSSSRTGEHAQDHGYSADDVPSLTSSASTVFSTNPPRFSSSAGTRSSGDRSSSLTSAVPMQTRPANAGKRSSLASLSRLVGSSYSERSKLSIESRASHDESDKPDKKKGNRISRLMRFWKSKEKLDSS